MGRGAAGPTVRSGLYRICKFSPNLQILLARNSSRWRMEVAPMGIFAGNPGEAHVGSPSRITIRPFEKHMSPKRRTYSNDANC